MSDPDCYHTTVCTECGEETTDYTYHAALCDSGLTEADLPIVCQRCFETVEWHAEDCDCQG